MSVCLRIAQTRSKVAKAMPDIPPLDIMKEVGKSWKRVNEQDMRRYKQLAKTDTTRYQEELEVFINMLN